MIEGINFMLHIFYHVFLKVQILSQTEKDKYSMWNLKKKKASEYSKKEANTDIENKLVVTSGEREWGRG